jgi:prophage regulatory protein
MASNGAIDDEMPVARSAAVAPANARIVRLPQVCAMTGLGRSMIYQMEAEGRFPRRVSIGVRAVGWVESEVQEWLQRRIERRRAQTASPCDAVCLPRNREMLRELASSALTGRLTADHSGRAPCHPVALPGNEVAFAFGILATSTDAVSQRQP